MSLKRELGKAFRNIEERKIGVLGRINMTDEGNIRKSNYVRKNVRVNSER